MQKNSCCGTFQILLPKIFKNDIKIRETRGLKEQSEKNEEFEILELES